MPLPLALIASGSNIIVESHDEGSDRFLSAASTILTRIPPNSSRLSYAFEEWVSVKIRCDFESSLLALVLRCRC